MAWPETGRFVAQLVGWTLPAPQVEGLAATVSLAEEGAVIRAEASNEEGHPRNFLDVSAVVIGPDQAAGASEDGGQAAPAEVALAQVGAGRYEAPFDAAQPGTYLVRLQVRDGEEVLGQQTLGLAVPYSPEYRAAGIDLPGLESLAAATGGGRLSGPAQAFVHDLAVAARVREVSMALLLAVALLFPLDVAVRRVMIGGGDVRRAVAWLAARLPARRRAKAGGQQALGRLWQARERARERQARSGTRAAADKVPREGPIEEKPESPVTPSSAEALERLRKAKERARRGGRR
jgi:hypothetical protein